MGRILVTGTAGFIGFHLSQKLLKLGNEVIGIDSLNEYYDVNLKHDRLRQLKDDSNFQFYHLDISDRTALPELFVKHSFTRVVHLAAQAGVRYSLTNPHAYVDSNLVGFLNILEACRHAKIEHLVFASSSSVYGANTKRPFSVQDPVNHPISLYAATKRSNELMAHSYSHLYGMAVTGLRFFSVYGPWGRPDMALFLFTKAILEGKPIDVFNGGKMQRNFTYIDDVVEGVSRLMDKIPTPAPNALQDLSDPSTSYAPFKIYNIGNHQTVQLGYFIEVLENYLGKKATQNLLPLQPGDVPQADADITDLKREIGFQPDTPIEVGIPKFVDWYRSYNRW
ncbi:NAD-dependent epimerase [Kovacikia minuta CCNUW1]|uniref:NAD-dependent epimerase n=1 Tax=Kovacikia minuta TaxID=2931930 RepID=UPI001CC8F95E|nr:NAD-dependent epimerase [Kovacikia minuta]UBF28043.1 NAD-dependent epimerase [Kovacikia minuta CCNUW1]